MNEYVKKQKEKLIKKYTGSNARVQGNSSEIYNIMEASFRNMFRSMYPDLLQGKSCEWCHATKNLNRCHANKSRPEIAFEAISNVDEINGSKSWPDIMIEFVSLHENEPVKILCQKCHFKFDLKKTNMN
jgi:hypothetical protein